MFNRNEIAVVKGMLARGDKQHSIAAHFNCNAGRIAEIATGKVGSAVEAAPANELPSTAPMKRFFTPGMPLQEQIAVFDSLAKQGPFDVARAHYVSPELAEYILQQFNTTGTGKPGNRPKRANNIGRFADDMRDDCWGLTGETLIFSRPPVRLIDGQHRLAACVSAGVGFKTFIVFGIDYGEFTKINTGAKKTNADALAMRGVEDPSVVAAAIRWAHLLSHNALDRSALSNEFVVEFYDSLKKDGKHDLMHSFCDLARDITKVTKVQSKVPYSPGQLAGVLFTLNSRDAKVTQKFADALFFGKGAGKVLTTKLVKILEHGRIHDVARAAMLIKAWNFVKQGETPSPGKLTWDAEKEDFPSF